MRTLGRGQGGVALISLITILSPVLGQSRNLTSHLTMDLVAKQQAKSEFMDVIDPVSKTNFGTEPITQFGGSDVWDLDYTLLQSFEKEGDWTVGEVYTQAAWIYWRHKGPDFRVLFDGNGQQAITLKGNELGMSVDSAGPEASFFGTGFHIDLDKWSFVCVVGQSSGSKGASTFYVATPEDGTVQKAGSVPMTIAGARLQAIGAEGRCPGKLAMYKCWNGVALEEDEVQKLYEQTLHLVPSPPTTTATTSTYTSVTSTSTVSSTTTSTATTATRTSRTATTTSTFTTTTRSSHTTTTTGTQTATARTPAELRFQLDGQPTAAESGMTPPDMEASLDAPTFTTVPAITPSTTVTTTSTTLDEEESLANELDFIGIVTRPPTTTTATATATATVGPVTPASAAGDSRSAVGGSPSATGAPSIPSSVNASLSTSAGSAENRASSSSSTSAATSAATATSEASAVSQNESKSVYGTWGEDIPAAESRVGASNSSATGPSVATQVVGAASVTTSLSQNSSVASARETMPAGSTSRAAEPSSVAGQPAATSGRLAGQVTTSSTSVAQSAGGATTATQALRYSDGASVAGGTSSTSQELVPKAGSVSSGATNSAASSSNSAVAGSRLSESVSAAAPQSAVIPAAAASAAAGISNQAAGPASGHPPPVSAAASSLPHVSTDAEVNFEAPGVPSLPSLGLPTSVGLHSTLPDGSVHFPWWALLITLGLLLCAGAAAIWVCCIDSASKATSSRGARLLEASSGSYAALPTDDSVAALEAGHKAKAAAVSGAAHQCGGTTHHHTAAATSAATSSAVVAGTRGVVGTKVGTGVAIRGAGQLVGRGPGGPGVALAPLSLPPPKPAQPVQPVLASSAGLQRGVQTVTQQQRQQQQLVQLVQLDSSWQQLPTGQAQLPVPQVQQQLGGGAQVRAPSPSQVLTASPSPALVMTQSQSAANTTTELLVELLSSEPVRIASPPSSPSRLAVSGQGQSGRPLPPHRVQRQSVPTPSLGTQAAQATGWGAPTTTAVLLPVKASASREHS